MIKKVLKGLGVLAIGGFAVGLIWYFQSLKIDGDPLLTACWAVDIYDDVTGEKVVGAEDLDFDPETGTVFLSAYDRRAVAREIDAGKVTTQGGIYTFQVSDITDAATMQVTDISRDFKEAGNEFRPHGFVLYPRGEGLITINRLYPTIEGEVILTPVILDLFLFPDSLAFVGKNKFENVCDPYDLAFTETDLVFTDVTEPCEGSWFGTGGNIKIPKGSNAGIIKEDLSYPNGIAKVKNNLAVSLTRKKAIQFFETKEFSLVNETPLEIAPDNLTVDEKDNLYVAGFPNLIDYFYYMKGWLGVKKSPSAAYRISPDDYAQELLFKNDGTMISGATVAQRAGDYLILGSGWDDNIAICSGMNRLD